MEREPAIKPLHHRRHVGKEPIGSAVPGLLEDGREDHAADLLLEEGKAGDDEVCFGEIHVLQDLIHAVGAVVDDGDAVAEFVVQEVHIGLFEFDKDDVSPWLAAGDQFMGEGAVAGTEFYDGLYFIQSIPETMALPAAFELGITEALRSGFLRKLSRKRERSFQTLWCTR